MSYDLSIGNQIEDRFANTVAGIARDARMGHYNQVSTKLNNALFNGGPFAPKSFSQLISNDPSSAVTITPVMLRQQTASHVWEEDGRFFNLIKIEKKCSFSTVMGYLEAIPVIGSALAIINAIGHYIGMKSARNGLERASLELLQNRDEDALPKTQEVFAQAMEYTKHRNALGGSLLSIIPLLKPIVRLFQGIMYHEKTPQMRISAQQPAAVSQNVKTSVQKHQDEICGEKHQDDVLANRQKKARNNQLESLAKMEQLVEGLRSSLPSEISKKYLPLILGYC